MRQKIDLKLAVATAPVPTPIAINFDELIRAYCADKFDDSLSRLNKWIAAFSNRSAWEIGTHEIQAAADALIQAGYKAGSVNRDVSYIGQVYRWAKARKITPPAFVSPTLNFPRFPEGVRVVSLTDAEVSRLLAGSKRFRDRRFSVLVHLLHCTGCRKSEVLNRRWADVDLDNKRILADKTKTGVPRFLFLDDETVKLMRRVYANHPKSPDDLLFEGRIKGNPIDYRMTWVKLATSIGRPDLHMHDLRHHRAKELLLSGASVAIAAQVLGHSSNILQTRYGHLEVVHKQAAIEASWAG